MNRALRRYYRTVSLGLAAMALLVWAAVDQFAIPWEDMASLLLSVVVAIAVVILLAALVAAMWVAVRALLKRGRGD